MQGGKVNWDWTGIVFFPGNGKQPQSCAVLELFANPQGRVQDSQKGVYVCVCGRDRWVEKLEIVHYFTDVCG